MKKILRLLFIIGPCLFLFTKDVHAADIELSYFNLSPGTKYSISTSGSKISISGGFTNVGSVVSDDSSFLNLYFETQGHISASYSGNTFGAPIVVRLNVNSNGNGIWLVQLPFKNSVELNQTLLFNGTLTLKSDFNYNFYGTYIASTIGTMPYDEKYTDQFENIGFQLDKILEAIKQQNSNNNTSSITSNQQIQIQQQAQIIQQNSDSLMKQNKTNELIESEDDDTTSKKCGMLCKLKGIFTGIIELPGKLVNLLIDALKSLFIPTDEQLYNIINKAQNLTENFGFVGEAMNFFINIFTSLLGLVNANGCIELPEFTIGATSLFEAHTFWNAQQVCLSNNPILSSNIDTIRTITSIVLVCLFINFAASKFFSILSKNDNEVTSGMAASTRGEV